jgi:glyoxylase I family protein
MIANGRVRGALPALGQPKTPATIPHSDRLGKEFRHRGIVPTFPSIAHVAVTVSDLQRSTIWYAELFGSAPVLDEDEQSGGFHHTVFALDEEQLFGLHTHPDSDRQRFDERRPGLDHVSFTCRDREELVAWAARLDELTIEHGGIKDAHYGSGISFRDPDGIALEFFAPPA